MQICEYFFENACYSVTKYYLCRQNNKRSLLGRKQQSQVARSFPNRYLFSCIIKVTSLFSISCISDIILPRKMAEMGNRLGGQRGREGPMLGGIVANSGSHSRRQARPRRASKRGHRGRERQEAWQDRAPFAAT